MDSSVGWYSAGFSFRTFVFPGLNTSDLAEGISWTTKLLADDTSLFSIVNNINESANQINMDLERISLWACQQKMSFNPTISKQAQEVIFSKKNVNIPHPLLYFNTTPVIRCSYQKHLGVNVDKKTKFSSTY